MSNNLSLCIILERPMDIKRKKEILVQKRIKRLKTNVSDFNYTEHVRNGIARGRDFSVEVWIEDKATLQGPFELFVRSDATVGDLRREAEISLGLDARLQRWVVGTSICCDDSITLASLTSERQQARFFLYLVEATSRENANIIENGTDTENTGNVYSELVQLELRPIVPNAEAFECEVCFIECGPGEGVVLRDCVHTFCRQCLSDVVRHSEEPQVSCPALGCSGLLQEREIRALVPTEDYERWLRRGLAVAESGTRDTFHCLTRDCAGWAFCEPGVAHFPCPVCKCINCLLCKAIHEWTTCEEYRQEVSYNNKESEESKKLIESLIAKAEAMKCPQCETVIMKKAGCDWLICSACKTEICWVTRGPRWGPAGRGDTSAGCRCGVRGKRCHPKCANCH